MTKIAPSILSADFTKLGNEIGSVSSADYLHFDVMDGIFVPNISIGLPVLESVRKIANMPLDIHLMITSPSRYTARFSEAGADIVTFHIEAETAENIYRAARELHKLGKKVGLSLKPNTPAEEVLPFVGVLDVVLIMAVEPGFGGQVFIDDALRKISLLRYVIDDRRLSCDIEIDGGINPENAKRCVAAGADILVAGQAIFGSPDRAARIAELRAAQ